MRGPFLSLLLAVVMYGLPDSALAQQPLPEDPIRLQYASFDPILGEPVIPAALRAGEEPELWIVQSLGAPTENWRASLRRAGAQIHGYLPEHAYVVRMPAQTALVVRGLPAVRAVVPYHPAYRLEAFLLQELANRPVSDIEQRRYNLVVVDKANDKATLIPAIVAIGGRIDHEQPGSILLEVTLDGAQLLRTAAMNQVLWIDRWTAPELDMDNARIQGGGNYVETVGGYTGKGINGHVYEGVEAGHKDFTNTPINVLSSGSAQTHGHCTAGIVFGNGTSIAGARGMAPDAQPFYTTYTSVSSGYSRWQVVDRLVNTHQVMFTTASWGGSRTTAYTSTSADTDDIIFDHDIVWTNSQSNAGNQQSRPEAWAKNIMSIGGVAHRNNSNPADDSWQAGGGSTGPAADGRIKPDLAAYYDGILCSDLTGSAGYNRSGDYYTSFGGTSGATPIVAGHNALAIQMFTDGLFGPQRVPNGTRWQNKPHCTTHKALMIANAAQYAFTKTSTDNRREHVGWGFPDLKTMYDRRNVHFVVDETDILKHGQGMSYKILVGSNQPELKIALCYADPAGNPSAAYTRINELSLRVSSPSSTKYWGNHGLKDGNYSVAGGQRDERDTVECVFVKDPEPGLWTIDVGAFLVVQDSHVETTATDADFGLVAVGGTFVSKQTVELDVAGFSTFGQGCPSAPGCTICYGRNWSLASGNRSTTASKIAILDYPDDATKICGLDLLMRAKSGTVDVEVAIHDFDQQTAQPGKKFASQTIRVDTQLKAWSVSFPNGPTIPKNWVYYIVLDKADQLILPAASSGTNHPHYEMRNNQWSTQLFYDTPWQYRVHCDKGQRVPVLSSAERPLIGTTMVYELSNARGNVPAIMLFGASDKLWGQLQLPFSYAANCSLLVSGEILMTLVTDAQGNGEVRMPIPNSRGLIGFVGFQQFFVPDSANPIGVISSNAGRIRIGEF